MNQTELLQLMIVNAVKDGMKQALDEALKPIKEELGKVKALNAKMLKEGFTTTQPAAVQPTFGKIPRPMHDVQINEGVSTYKPANNASMDMLKAQAAAFVNADGMLPDIEIDPGMFLKR